MKFESGIYGCCGDDSCLRQHIVEVHADIFERTCGMRAVRTKSYCYYLEAIAYREQQTVPKVGVSIDRRTFQHVKADLSEDAVKALMCMCCARIRTSSNGRTEISRMRAGYYFKKICSKSFRMNWCFQQYKSNYVNTPRKDILKDHPELDENCWLWRRLLQGTGYHGQVILCCPEDVECERRHDSHILCPECLCPLCDRCFVTSLHADDALVCIPEALANDNFWGYVTSIIYKYRVRWIEATAACPVFTALITYYVEGDRGHLLNAEQHRPQRAYAVRGNVYSFHMPWEYIFKKLGKVLEDEEVESLPHSPQMLASVVLFSLRIGDVVDLNKWLPQAKLRPHVVLKLLFALVDNKYPFRRSNTDPISLKNRFAELVGRHYPERSHSCEI